MLSRKFTFLTDTPDNDKDLYFTATVYFDRDDGIIIDEKTVQFDDVEGFTHEELQEYVLQKIAADYDDFVKQVIDDCEERGRERYE
jgi:hypothetical protein